MEVPYKIKLLWGDFDETPLQFDMATGRTYDFTGAKEIIIQTTRGVKMRFTALIAILSNGVVLPPLLVFKSKKPLLSELYKVYSHRCLLFANSKGWVNEDIENNNEKVVAEEFDSSNGEVSNQENLDIEEEEEFEDDLVSSFEDESMHASSSNRHTPKLSMFKKALTNFLEDDNDPYVLGGDVTTKKFENNKGLIKGQKELGDYFKKL